MDITNEGISRKIPTISVTQLNRYIKSKIDSDENLQSVYVKGELSNVKLHYSGHIYFTLKDETSLIKCVMFRSYAQNLSFVPKDGMKVNVLGEIKVFERDGVYQLYAFGIREDGIGSLYEKYEELKAKLEKEGLFDKSHKKEIPKYPKIIGVLTASTGAVIRDIINVSTRRNPNVRIRLIPVPVQGKDAAPKIAAGIKRMNDENLCDTLIIGRGGGSLEDLWPFNEEEVAYAIYNSKIPIISAVGHETDFTIADFVADLRAPTPSAAAELAVPNIQDVINSINQYEERYKNDLKKKAKIADLRFEKCMNLRVFKEPLQKINERYLNLDFLVNKIETNIKKNLEKSKTDFSKIITKIDSLSPMKTLSRGYIIAEDNKEKIIKSVNDTKKDENINLVFSDGKVKTKVIEINKN